MSITDPDIPNFTLYGKNIPAFDDSIQPVLELRSWSDVPKEERSTALCKIANDGWLKRDGEEHILNAIAHLNHTYLRCCPGRNLHVVPRDNAGSDQAMRRAAGEDFVRIFLEEEEALVMRMLSKFAERLIEKYSLERARKTRESDGRAKYVSEAFDKFDRFANCLNHIFEQFAVNQLMTRTGFMPRQDETIERELYKPTLLALSDPKWKAVNNILAPMFEDFREKRYSETITKAHSAIHCFLQILVGEPGKNGKGELGRLIEHAKKTGLIPTNQFTKPFLANIQSFITSERATNSTAKPALIQASSSDALLMMNMTLLFLQHCLQGR